MKSLGQIWFEAVVAPPAYKVGSVVIIDGKKAKITGGQWWGTYGLSNHWSWKFYTKKGNLSRIQHSGYGEDWKVVKC